MEIKFVDNTKDINCDVLVINKYEGEQTSNDLINKFAPDTFTGKAGEIFTMHTQGQYPSTYITAVGFGSREKLDGNIIRENIAKAVKKCNELKAKTVAFDIEANQDTATVTIIGASAANYKFDKYKTKKDPKLEEIYVLKSAPDAEQAKYIAEAMEFTRNLANEPAEYATPTKLADIAQNIEGVETKVYGKEQIKQMGMGAFYAVARGSAEEPKFIHMKYSSPNPQKRIAIIGKGLCFDSGGLDIKPAASMLTMKDDMSGAACILGVMKALNKFRPDIEVHGIIAACENMPGCAAYKPGDILTAKNGKTIEVDNTDAEGRLTLADALCYACDLGVDEVIDIATLTGACMVALGTAASGIMGNNSDFVNEIIKTGKSCGEKFWELPMWQEYRDNMNSDVADMKNTGTRYGGASAAGMFLKEFVTDNVKWAHLDVAGTAFLDSPHKEFGKGATGVGVRTILNYIISR